MRAACDDENTVFVILIRDILMDKSTCAPLSTELQANITQGGPSENGHFTSKTGYNPFSCDDYQFTGCVAPSQHGDGYCDDANNVEACFFDDGDCCGPNVNTDFCIKCECLDVNYY